ncbi:MAG: transglutaminase-like domain-containing protein [Clostridiales bacterium]|nr:transglutaminase-like domain-containing protein [Clostridiales bacterium]
MRKEAFYLRSALGRPKTLRAIILLLCLNLVFQGQTLVKKLSPDAQLRTSEHWYVVKIGGTEVGYLREALLSAFAGKSMAASTRIRTETEMHLVLNRMGSPVELSSFSAIEEDLSGRLLTSRFEMKLSNQVTVTEASIKDGLIEIRSEAGGKPYTRTLEHDGELLGPEGIRMMSARGLKEIGDAVSAQTFVSEASLVTTLSRTLKARENLEIAGARLTALRIEETLRDMPTKRTLWLDEEGFIIKQEEPGPFGVIEAIRSDKERALLAASGGELPVEMYERSIIKANVRLPRSKPIDRLKVRLTHRNPELGWPELTQPGQQVIEKTEKMLILEVKRLEPRKETLFPVALTGQNRPFLEPNAYIQSDDMEIRRLAGELVSHEKDAFRAALRLKRWVSENMTFDLGLVFAPANEIFKDRRGTCIGYATLLATLARAVGIPSRVALGYVYALGMFGGHAWTEIQVGKEWIPLDPAIVNESAADATRIAFLASSLAEGPGEPGLGAAQQVFGHVDIEILEYEMDGKIRVVQADSRLFSIEGNRYQNPWLGVTIEKPDDFEFTKLDAIWPDRTVVAFKRYGRDRESSSGEHIALEQHEVYPWQDAAKEARKKLKALVPGGKELKIELASAQPALAIINAEGSRTALAVCRGIEVFILRVEGNNASTTLLQLARNFHIED